MGLIAVWHNNRALCTLGVYHRGRQPTRCHNGGHPARPGRKGQQWQPSTHAGPVRASTQGSEPC